MSHDTEHTNHPLNAQSFLQALPADLYNALSLYDRPIATNSANAAYFIQKVLDAEHMEITEAHYPIGARMLGETARITHATHIDTPSYCPIKITSEQYLGWSEGIFHTTLAWRNGSNTPIRVFHLGYQADESGRIIIKHVQKHLLNLDYRRTEEAKKKNQWEEKRAGDAIWREIRRQSGFPPELFGFLCASVLLGPHSTNQEITFITPDLQPQIMKRYTILAIKSRVQHFEQIDPAEVEQVYKEIDMIRKVTDFGAMLSSMGVLHWETNREGYRATTLPHILEGIQHHWTDDEHHDRYELRKLLYTFLRMQL